MVWIGGFGGVEMTNHLCAQVEDWFEMFTNQLVLAILIVLGRDLAPHISGQDDVLRYPITAEFMEHPEIPSSDPSEPFVGDAMNVDESRKLEPSLASVDERRYAYMVAK